MKGVLELLPLGVGRDEVGPHGAPSKIFYTWSYLSLLFADVVCVNRDRSMAPKSYCISVVVVGHTVA